RVGDVVDDGIDLQPRTGRGECDRVLAINADMGHAFAPRGRYLAPRDHAHGVPVLEQSGDNSPPVEPAAANNQHAHPAHDTVQPTRGAGCGCATSRVQSVEQLLRLEEESWNRGKPWSATVRRSRARSTMRSR